MTTLNIEQIATVTKENIPSLSVDYIKKNIQLKFEGNPFQMEHKNKVYWAIDEYKFEATSFGMPHQSISISTL